MPIPLLSVSNRLLGNHLGGCWSIPVIDGSSLARHGGVEVGRVCTETFSECAADGCDGGVRQVARKSERGSSRFSEKSTPTLTTLQVQSWGHSLPSSPICSNQLPCPDAQPSTRNSLDDPRTAGSQAGLLPLEDCSQAFG